MRKFEPMAQPPNRTYLSVDYGSRRIGLAKSDPTGLIASALKTIEVRSTKEALAKLQEVIESTSPAAIVFGYPLLESGEPGAKCREIDKFVEKLKKIFDGPIHLVDESYSSVEASAIIHAHGKQAGRDKKRIDRLAATIILQRFLEEQSATDNTG